MKQISQEEFEKLVREIIEGKTTRKKLAKSLDTDIRTINHKITELANENPKLYEEYVKKFPYQPKTREDIDFEALVIYIMKNSKTLAKVSEEFDISTRTIARRIKDMEKTNPDLIKIYRIYAENLKKGNMISFKIQEMIDILELKPVSLSKTSIEVKENQLRETLQKFEELLSQGMSKAEAARTLGYDDYPTIWKKIQELKRIEEEKKIVTKVDSKSKKFRNSMRIDSKTPTNSNNGEVDKKDISTQNIIKEGR